MILAFTDCETTHLSAEVGEVWEVAVILRDHDGSEDEYVWQFAPDLGKADPESLQIGRFEERYRVEPGDEAAVITADGKALPVTRKQAVRAITSILRGATLVGSNPGFDDRFLRKLVGLGNQQWAYRPACIANLAEGYLRHAKPELWEDDSFPASSHWLSRQMGVEPPGPDVAHTALGDARWARDVYLAVAGTKAVTA